SRSAPPLGLLYVATYAIQHGHDVRIIDQATFGWSDEKILDHVRHVNPDVVGFTILSESVKNAKVLAAKMKAEDPNLKIVFGNYLPTFYARKMLEQYPWLDACVRGEGEETFTALMEAWERGRPLDGIPGISFRTASTIKENPDRPLTKDLDTLPIPDRKLLPDIYKNRMCGVELSKRKFTIMISSRGCPYACTFCACTTFTKGSFRARSVDNVFKEICELGSMGYKDIILVDDNFTLKKNRVIELCQKIRKERMDMFFTTDGRVNHSDLNLYRHMATAGFTALMLGFESGVQRLLDYYNKKITLAMSEKAVKLARKGGIDVIIGAFLIGAPDETYQEVLQTINFIKTLDIDFPQLILTRALPGTPLFNDLARKHVLDEELHWEKGVDVIDLPGTIMQRKALKRLVNERFPGIFLRPSYLSRALYRNFRSKYRREIVNSHLNPSDIRKVGVVFKNALDLF
ncbi:MAG: radical SAM protein, partial [Candidatus Sigynarchaeota archaeon]